MIIVNELVGRLAELEDLRAKLQEAIREDGHFYSAAEMGRLMRLESIMQQCAGVLKEIIEAS